MVVRPSIFYRTHFSVKYYILAQGQIGNIFWCGKTVNLSAHKIKANPFSWTQYLLSSHNPIILKSYYFRV